MPTVQQKTQQNPRYLAHLARLPPRLRAWKLANPGHIPLRHRQDIPKREARGLLERFMVALFPWSRREYPGRGRLFARLLGVSSVETARQYRKPGKLPRYRAKMLASFARAKAAELEAIAADLDEYAKGGAEKNDACGKVKVPMREKVKKVKIPG